MTITNLNVFQSGTLASVTPVNENFETLRVAVNSVEQNVTSNRTYLDNKITEVNSTIANAVNGTKTSGAVFCVNNGPIDVYGEPGILNISGTTLSFNVPFKATNINGNTLEPAFISSVSVSGYADGIYNVFVDLNGNTEILNNTIYRQPKAPLGVINNIWLDTSSAPLKAKRYTSDGWVDFLKIPLGYFRIVSGAVTEVKTLNYNQNGYNINSSSNFPMPDYKKGVSKANEVAYTAETSGWLYVYYAGHFNSATASITIDGVSFNITMLYYLQTSCGSGAGMFIPVAKGSVYIGYGIGDFRFYPAVVL